MQDVPGDGTLSSGYPTYYPCSDFTLGEAGLEARTLLRELRTLSHCYDGVVRVQESFRDMLPATAAHIATRSVASLSDLLDEASQAANALSSQGSSLLSPCELRVIGLCMAIEGQDYREMRRRAAALVDGDDVPLAIDAVASFLAAMRFAADADTEVGRCGLTTLTAH